MFSRAVDGIQVIIAIVKEIADFLPGRGTEGGVFAPQGFVQRGEAFMGLAVGAMQVQEGAGKGRGVGGGKAQIGQGRGGGGEDRAWPRPAPTQPSLSASTSSAQWTR